MKVSDTAAYTETFETKKVRITSFYVVAHITFFLYLFFLFYGTSVPFQEHIQDIDEISTSNIVNQVVYTLLFLTALYSLIPKWNFVISLIRKEKIFFIFLLWCSLTLLWSQYPFISFKRLFQYLTTYFVYLSILSHIGSPSQLFKYFKFFLSIYVVVCLASIFTVPAAVDDYGAWRGLAASKNHLGQMSLICILFFSHFATTSTLKQKIFFGILLLFALILFLGSSSVTSLLTLLLIIGLIGGQYLDKLFEGVRIGRTISVITSLFIIILIALTLFLAPGLLAGVVGEAGKDLTLTGRTDLWHDVFQFAKRHLILGCGFQGFWVLDSLQIQELYQSYIWLPIQSHNGYLDILNETGLIGLFLFLMTAIKYFINLKKMHSGYFWKWLVVAALVVNLTESTLIRPNIPSGALYTFSYLVMFASIYKNEHPEIYGEDNE